MSRWVGVHGIGQHYLGRNQILGRWTPALTDGLEAATRQRLKVDLDLAFYGDLFRPAFPERPVKGAQAGADSPFLAGIDDAELADLTAAVAEIVPPADLAGAGVAGGKGVAVPAGVGTLIGAVERRFPASAVLFIGTLRQVHRYLRDPRLKVEIDRVTAGAAADASVLIAHSLGSVVAYEFLRQHVGHSVKLLLTLGSPLGLRMVRELLPAGEPGVSEWVNLRSPNDPVAAAGNLRRWYPGVTDQKVHNGFDAHSVERYLCDKKAGNALKGYLPLADE